MKKILKTTHLEFDKSSFLIDLIKHTNGVRYVEITQTIQNGEKGSHSIKINPYVLDRLIETLQEYTIEIPKKEVRKKGYLPESKKQKIQDCYLKGLSLKDLAMQFEQSEEEIKRVLISRGIVVVQSQKYKAKRWRKWKK